VTTDAQLGELLVGQGLMTGAQLTTAVDFQKSLGGNLRNIVVKLGYVKDSVLAGLVAQEEHIEASVQITPDVVDFDMVKAISKEILEKHSVLPLKSPDHTTVVLAMADPNNLRAIEEIQFRVNRSVEPAVTTKAAIRKALNNLGDWHRQNESRAGGKIPADRLKQIKNTPVDKLLRAYLVLQIEKGELSLEDLLARASKL
jgi:autonomous glycyl radical cofactor GrcA